VLFLVALVLHLVGGLIYGPATTSEDFLERADPNRSTVTLGVLIEFVAVLAIPMIGFLMFPVLERCSEALALAYSGFRLLDAALLIVIAGKVLTLIDLSEDHRSGDATDGGGLQAIGDSLLFQKDSVFVLYVLVFAVGAMIFYAMLHRMRLVPGWLSIGGFGAALWMLLGTVLAMFDAFSDSSAMVEAVFVIAVPLNELALAVWLIVKGFDGRSAFTNRHVDREPVPVEVG
jgi:hypothetical protein